MNKYVAIDKHGDFLWVSSELGVTTELGRATMLPMKAPPGIWSWETVAPKNAVAYLPAIEKRTVELVPQEGRGDYLGDIELDFPATGRGEDGDKKPDGEMGYVEGDVCNRNGCTGVITMGDVENCSCHIDAPCGQCTTPREFCGTCDWSVEDEPDGQQRL